MMTMAEAKFYGVDRGWMQAQWRDCKDKAEQLEIFRDMTGGKATVQQIIDAVGEPEYCGPIAAQVGKYTPWTPEEDEEVIRMVGEGKGDKEIAAVLGRKTYSVRKHIQYLRKRGKAVPYRVQKNAGPEEAEPESFARPEEAEPEPAAADVPDKYPNGSALPLELGDLPGAAEFEIIGQTLRALLDEEEALCARCRIVQDMIGEYRRRLGELLAMAGGGLTDGKG